MLATGTLNKILSVVQGKVETQEAHIFAGMLPDLASYKAACKVRHALIVLAQEIKEIANTEEDWED